MGSVRKRASFSAQLGLGSMIRASSNPYFRSTWCRPAAMKSANPRLSASLADKVRILSFSTSPATTTSLSTIAAAIWGSRPLLSARLSEFGPQSRDYFSSAGRGSAAPMEEPGAITKKSAARPIKAPADQARPPYIGDDGHGHFEDKIN